MTRHIQAIETKYDGYKFRSRLEARWAVFFDCMGVPWDYEVQGFETSLGWYLPDFFLPGACEGEGQWVEIKPLEPTSGELKKFEDVVFATKSSGAIMVGDPYKNLHPHNSTLVFTLPDASEPCKDKPAGFNGCHVCSAHGFSWEGAHTCIAHGGRKDYTAFNPRAVASATFSRSYRFDEGPMAKVSPIRIPAKEK